MTSTAPRIGFDRFIQLDWAAAALKVRVGTAKSEELEELLDSANLSVAAKRKTHTVLNRLWLAPRAELEDFANRGVDLYRADATISIAALTWGMAIATYSFFGKVAELVGRLSSLQGDCATSEVHRRMSEIYGEREGTYRMTNMVLQSQASWGAIERVEKGKRLIRKPPVAMVNDRAVAWLIEAALRYTAKALPVATLQSTAVVFPFALEQPLGYLTSNSPALEVRAEGPGDRFVVLRGDGAVVHDA